MNSYNFLYNLRDKIPVSIKVLFPKFLRRKINKKFFPYYFLSTDLKSLPNLNYDENEISNLEYQKKLLREFNDTEKLNSFMTCPHLTQLLSIKFNCNDNFSFLDIGGESIDFYLDLKKKFKNVEYFIFNKDPVNKIFDVLKQEFNLIDITIINSIEETFNKKFDFVNFGSCIQYINNYENILNEITNNNNCIFFSGTTLYNSKKDVLQKNLVVKQVNTSTRSNYLFFFNKRYFYEIFIKKNFELTFEEKNLTDNINYNNFGKYLKKIQYTDFLFTKK